MADEKISAMPAASALSGPELLAGVQSGANVKITATQVQTLSQTGVALLAAANTFTTTQTITPSTEVSALVLTGGTLAGTTSRPLISATQTWNNSGLTATGILLNVTDTSSNSASLLMDLQIAASSKFSVSKGGAIVSAGGLNVGANTVGCGFLTDIASNQFALGGAGVGQVGLRLGSGRVVSWNAATDLSGALDIGLSRIGAGVLGVGNGTAADVSGTISVGVLRINVAPTGVTQVTAMTINSGADSSSNIGHRISVNMNGTVYWIPASTTAF